MTLTPIGPLSSRDSAELAVLGSVLLSEDALDVLQTERIRPEHFRRIQHQALLAGMFTLRDQGQPVDALTLKGRFSSAQSPVSAADIELLSVAVPNVGNLRSYCRLLKEEAFFDDAYRALLEANDAINDRDRDGILAALSRLDEADDRDGEQSNQDEFLTWYESDVRGWPLPFDALTDASKGMKPGEVTILGGWSGHGKSFLLAQMLRCVVKAGARAHEFANEMHGPTRTARTITAMTGIPSWVIEQKKLKDDQHSQVMQALKSLPYETTASAGWTVEDYCRRIRKEKWDVAAIDTVTNLPCSRVDEWDRACVMLADAAAQAGTHLIEVSQLNLERDKGKKPPPVGRDLRNTGAWYQRARIVMFIHREQESIETGDGQVLWRETPSGHVRVEKASHGEGALVPVMFSEKFLRFNQMETRDQWVAA